MYKIERIPEAEPLNKESVISQIREITDSYNLDENVYWTIEEADVGGMLGGYPRWLSWQGNYTETDPSKFKTFESEEELEASPEWQRVKDNKDYTKYSFKKPEKTFYNTWEMGREYKKFRELALRAVQLLEESY